MNRSADDLVPAEPDGLAPTGSHPTCWRWPAPGLMGFGRRGAFTRAGAVAVLASSLGQRLGVLESEKQSARDPAQALTVQERRVAAAS
jgi:hypothetical protein